MEQRIGGVGAADIAAVVAQLLYGGNDDLDFFPPQGATLSGMGVESGDGEAGPLNPELALKASYRRARLGDDRVGCQHLGDVAKGGLDGYRERLSGWPPRAHSHPFPGTRPGFGAEPGL